MTTIDWLRTHAPGFSALSPDERNAIMCFSFLWSFFEAKALHESASSAKILALTHEWQASGRLVAELFSHSLAYFRDRYFHDGANTHYFNGLNLRNNDCKSLVKDVLIGRNNNAADSVAVLLIIIYRFRNNLFHGSKWSYEIHGQLDNFINANNVLMAALEIHDGDDNASPRT